MKAAFAWLGRTGLLYLLLCAGIAFYIFAWPAITAQFSGDDLRQDVMSIDGVRDMLADDRRAAQAALQARGNAIRDDGLEALNTRMAAAKRDRSVVASQLAQDGSWLDGIRPSRILATKRLELRRAALDAEIEALGFALEARKRRSALLRAETALREYPRIPTTQAIATARTICRDARRDLDAFESRYPADRLVRDVFLEQRQRLISARNDACERANDLAEFRATGLAARARTVEARERLEQARGWTLAALPDPAQDISDRTIRDVAVRAAVALLALLLLPLIVRTIFYYALAPIVQKGPPIRLGPASGMMREAAPVAPSRPSIDVTLGRREELLIRQSYLQSSQSGADMRTRWLLDWRSPFTSLASGMAFLTRARRAEDGAQATFGVSARDNPFAEVARIDLAPGDAIVLQPRGLAAVIQPIDHPLLIRSRWRIFNLHAWLTFQFRYLVFHGPPQETIGLIVKGGRGVRVEAAKAGRVFGQNQLIGFSAQTAYAIRRSETFLPYLFGREPLFRDRVADVEGTEGGGGILIIEEAPMAGQRSGIRGGLENAMDAVLKAFGV
ncbi:MAG: hypothetical protein WA948_09055 [Pontixanthobacter sp.]